MGRAGKALRSTYPLSFPALKSHNSINNSNKKKKSSATSNNDSDNSNNSNNNSNGAGGGYDEDKKDNGRSMRWIDTKLSTGQ